MESTEEPLTEPKEVLSDNSSNAISESDNSLEGIKNTNKNRKRKLVEVADLPASNSSRTTPRRAATLKRTRVYTAEPASFAEDLDDPDEPDYEVSDSDDDPDFAPSSENGRNNVESSSPVIKGRRFSKSNASIGANKDKSTTETTPSKPPIEKKSPIISDNTISSTQDVKSTSSRLSSGYKYVTSRTRQNQAVRLPEGPNLSEDQLKLIESQFKNGDFVMAKTDSDMLDNPPIWRIDGKSLLQKFQAFEKDGKILYRNVSTYSGWTAQAKALYMPVKVNAIFQSRYDVVVELLPLENKKGFGNKSLETSDMHIPEEIANYDGVFEIYLQSLISQALDASFLQEIYDENDEYFVKKIEQIDSLAEERKSKLLTLVSWKKDFKVSLEVWPSLNTMVSELCESCGACGKKPTTRLAQFYGQPYNAHTLRFVEPTQRDQQNKTFHTCDMCATVSELYNKMTHLKHEFYVQCKSTVASVRVLNPNKTTTNILKDLLANDQWIKGLFRSLCTNVVKIDNLAKEHNQS